MRICARVGAGECLHLYAQETFNELVQTMVSPMFLPPGKTHSTTLFDTTPLWQMYLFRHRALLQAEAVP
ncbi:hypothetical protein GCM10009621_04100 [Corynebacterium felinum]